MGDPVILTRDDGIGVITINNPPVNALGHAVRQGLWDCVEMAEADPAITAIVIIGAGRTFPAGADITEFGKPLKDPGLPQVIDRIEACTKPVVAALHGTALGGGFEIALGCHYRVADTTARVGLPEVHLGLLPGAGGTQRMPRLSGAKVALDVMLSGTPIDVVTAQGAGVIDQVIDGDLLEGAIAYVQTVTAPRRTQDATQGFEDAAQYDAALAAAKTRVATRMRGQKSPAKIIECVAAARDLPFTEGRQFERAAFMDCMASDQSKGMIHAFFAERASAKVPEAQQGTPQPITHVGVIGGGTMGAGITQALLNAGLTVTMVEQTKDGAAKGYARIEQAYARQVDKGRMTESQKAKVLQLFSTSVDLGDLSKADLIIEAVFENVEVKRDVFAGLDQIARPDAVLATNTSYIDIDTISDVLSRPDRLIGLHFFSPANIMKLLEIVVPIGSEVNTVATGFALAKKLKKVPVRAGNAPGFIGNRIMRAYAESAMQMMEDGCSPYDIDAAIYDFGYPMGIFAMYDLAGLDISWANRKATAATRDPNARYVRIADLICEQGWFGQKTGRGYYQYPDGARKGVPDPEVLALIDQERARKGIAPTPLSPDQIIARYMAAMVNEGCKVLAEGVALKPSDIDVAAVHGYGFPRYRGGPMKYADMIGLDTILANLEDYATDDAEFWKPVPLLVELVAKGQSFGDLNKG